MTNYVFQPGPLEPASTEPFSFDVEVAYAGFWWSLNDHFHYRVTPEGWGVHEQSYRRKQVTSDYYEGTYTVHRVREDTQRQVQVRCYGGTEIELERNKQQLITWMNQERYNIAVHKSTVTETWDVEPVSYRVDQSHVLAHNKQALVTFTLDVHPDVRAEERIL